MSSPGDIIENTLPPPGTIAIPFGDFKNKLKQTECPPCTLSESDKLLAEALDGDIGAVIVQKFKRIIKSLHTRCGDTLLEHSRDYYQRFGRTWFLCLINRNNFFDDLVLLELQLLITNFPWVLEGKSEVLEMLYDMDVENEYMITIELYDPDTAATYEVYAAIKSSAEVYPEEDLLQRPWHMALDGQSEFANSGKWRCQGCHGTQVDTVLTGCVKCYSAYYCSDDCQSKDWAHHKTCCPILHKLRVQDEARKTKK